MKVAYKNPHGQVHQARDSVGLVIFDSIDAIDRGVNASLQAEPCIFLQQGYGCVHGYDSTPECSDLCYDVLHLGPQVLKGFQEQVKYLKLCYICAKLKIIDHDFPCWVIIRYYVIPSGSGKGDPPYIVSTFRDVAQYAHRGGGCIHNPNTGGYTWVYLM